MDVSIEKSYCRKCGNVIKNVDNAFIKGCPSCGSRTFSFVSNKLKAQLVDKQKRTNDLLASPDTAVKIEGKGKFSINLEALTNNMDEEPVILQDQYGRINIILNKS